MAGDPACRAACFTLIDGDPSAPFLVPIVMTLLMYVGRIEIVPVLVLFTASFRWSWAVARLNPDDSDGVVLCNKVKYPWECTHRLDYGYY